MSEDPRISEIRAVLTEYVSTSDLDAQLDVRRRIRAIVDREPPAPRVFFPGDMVPEDTLTINKRGYWGIVALKYTTEHVCVEVAKPSPEEWQAAVDRARDARANAEWQHTEGVTS